jgi:predicted AAA+ superfamily ATPase
MPTNHQRVTEGFDILTGVLAPYVARELRAKYQDEWWDQGVLRVLHENQRRDLPADGEDEELTHKLDPARCLILVDAQWDDLFRRKLSREHRTWIKELVGTRNKWAHKGLLDMADEDAWRALDTMTRLVEQIDSEAAERLRVLARTVRYGTEGPSTAATKLQERKPAMEDRAGVLTAVPRAGLKPWRQVAKPHPDVAAGRYRQAEFAADLSQVVRGTAEVEYQDPVEFFARTYLTEGIRGLLLGALRRVGGKTGEPVIQLKTAFGGGKTHSLLALYHLLRGRLSLASLPHVAAVVEEADVGGLPQARVAVLVGTALNPTKERRPPTLQGVTIRTLWGEIAVQLAEQAGNLKLYDLVREADRKGVPPGSDALRELFDACGPCLILIDELVAYARKVHGVPNLPSGSFEAIHTFVQELTEAARKSERTALVATIPESDIEMGGDVGQRVTQILEHTFGRMEAVWKPVGSEEGFEVVRRRLFLPLKDEDESARDDACRAFSEMYRTAAGDFPPECKEARYLERMKACYPIHPEVFDRLYGDWATLDRFQRTRGVLRLMAALIHDLWRRNDASLFIMPGSLGLDEASVRDELTRYLPEGWTAVIEGDVDGSRSQPLRADADNPRFGQSMAARRVARTILLGSAPHVVQQQVRGVEDVRVRLGVAQPGEQVSVFNDALSQLTDRLTYLYRRDRRYWYDTRPNLRRTVAERAQQLADDQVEAEIERRLRGFRERGDFKGVHTCPASSADVPDDQEARLAVLRPPQTHKANDNESIALSAAKDMLANRGGAPRQHANMLSFLAPDRDGMEGLKTEVRLFLAWQSVVQDQDALNLDTSQRNEAKQGRDQSEKSVQGKLLEAYRWLIAPTQQVANGNVSSLEWEISHVASGDEAPAVRAARRMRLSEHLIVKWSPALLKIELDRWFWRDQDHAGVKKVWDAFCAYCYLPKLRDQTVFIEAIQEGLENGDYFAYATSVSEDGRYEGLRLGARAAAIYVDAASVLVKPAKARAQLEAERPGPEIPPGPPPGPGPAPPPGPPPGPPTLELPSRFYGTVEVDANRAGRDVGRIGDEVLRHLVTLPRAKVTVTVEIAAEVPDGVSEDVQRVVTENCQTLKFKQHGFEKT